MIVKNQHELATTPLRRTAVQIIEAGIERVLPQTLVRTAVTYNRVKKTLSVSGASVCSVDGRVFVIGGGKAAGLMARALELVLTPESIVAGVVNCTSKNYHTKKIQIIEAGHPVPDERGEAGTRRMLALKEQYSIGERDVVVCLLSGGSSALMPCPADGLSLEDLQDTTKSLLRSGANIKEMNVVRKHLSMTKGGRLGHFFAPAKVVSLIISDVVGNDLESIASGPTVPDPSTFCEAREILARYKLAGRIPDSVVAFLERGCSGGEQETPKVLTNCFNYVVGDNTLALEAMSAEAARLGLRPYIVTSEQVGDPAEVATLRAGEIIEGKYNAYDAIIIGGETTPTLPDRPGVGGRNQHYAAVTLSSMRDYPGEWVLASVGTDGSDFLRGVAGAIVDNTQSAATISERIDIESYIRRYDSNALLKRLGGSLIVTGDTGTNVSDIMVYILK